MGSVSHFLLMRALYAGVGVVFVWEVSAPHATAAPVASGKTN